MGTPRHAGDAPEWAERRRREVLDEISRLGWPLPGSFSEGLYRECGSPGCRCHGEGGRRHGPYASWFRQVGGKTVTMSLSPGQVEAYR
ncbi:MAG: hypothetical protein LBK95_02455, partial [Bifidobacteriaceae bacterium]|nr:hypothetical protein [Bifidobacteriaceae bacterium]